MGVTVQFDYTKWVARYPEFTSVLQATAQAYFDEATIYHANDGSGPVKTAAAQLTLLNMVTAHIASRYAVRNGQQASDLVGRVSDATEGSVSVSTDMSDQPDSAAWWQQTKYGADYWAATVQFRNFQYRVPISRSQRPIWR